MMHVWNLSSNLLMRMQVVLPEGWSWSLLPVLMHSRRSPTPAPPPSGVCSHGFSLRHSAASTISTAIYGNPLSSQRAVASRPLTSRCSDDTRRAYVFWLLLL